MIDRRSDGFRSRVGPSFDFVCDAGRCRTDRERVGASKHRIDEFSRNRVNSVGLPEFTQMANLDFEQAGFHCCGTA